MEKNLGQRFLVWFGDCGHLKPRPVPVQNTVWFTPAENFWKPRKAFSLEFDSGDDGPMIMGGLKF